MHSSCDALTTLGFPASNNDNYCIESHISFQKHRIFHFSQARNQAYMAFYPDHTKLQGAEIVAPEGQVVQEVAGAVPVIGMNPLQPPVQHGRAGHQVRPDRCEFPKGILDVRVIRASGAVHLFALKGAFSEGPTFYLCEKCGL
ncbi:hypothetical protein [Microbulbifer magnicolonia]|uniref:hypothetical protein n=1 Tax=Microbulbifer magnicolonia TaxID=3109744 RepID=UPI002B40097B|nr:hypothetical protein [Microbulbifer sp. GG15]